MCYLVYIIGHGSLKDQQQGLVGTLKIVFKT